MSAAYEQTYNELYVRLSRCMDHTPPNDLAVPFARQGPPIDRLIETMDSLSTEAQPGAPRPAQQVKDNPDLKHAPDFPPTSTKKQPHLQPCDVKPLTLDVKDNRPGSVAGFLHTPQNYRREQHEVREKTAAILLSGASGGVVGPSSIYLSIADKIASLKKGIPVMRLDYRYPARNGYCCRDVVKAMDYLQNGYGISRFVLVGWSFGGAPVFTLGGRDERIVGCATVASQTADTDGIDGVATSNKPVLLLHGTGDGTLSPRCSERLRDAYQYATRGGECKMHLFQGDDHALTKNSLKAEEMICDFITRCAGFEVEDAERKVVLDKELVPPAEKVKKMEESGDVRQPESVQ